MQETTTTVPDAKDNHWWLAASALFGFMTSFLRNGYGVSTPVSIAIVGSVIYLAAYWILPRPKIEFWKYALWMEYALFGVAAAVWYIPAFLANKVPLWIAYSLPALAFFVSLYLGIKAVRSANQQTISFKKWLLVSAVITILITLIKPS